MDNDHLHSIWIQYAMLSSTNSSRTLLPFFSAFLVAALPRSPSFAATQSCVETYDDEYLEKYLSWNSLPETWESPLSPLLKTAIESSRWTKSLRDQYGNGSQLAIRASMLTVGSGGWEIQREFATRILRQIFPRIRYVESDSKDPNAVVLKLGDSIFGYTPDPDTMDMIDLKTLNFGPALPSRPILRTRMNLPLRARIASVYSSHTYGKSVAITLANLIRAGTADIFLISFQDPNITAQSVNEHTEIEGLPVFTDQQWSELDDARRPPRAVIFNLTRRRLPFIHAAADYAIVLGMANIMEPLHAGRPTYFTAKAAPHYSDEAWQRTAATAVASGGGHPFVDDRYLPTLIKQTSFINPKFDAGSVTESLDRVLRALIYSVRDSRRTEH